MPFSYKVTLQSAVLKLLEKVLKGLEAEHEYIDEHQSALLQ